MNRDFYDPCKMELAEEGDSTFFKCLDAEELIGAAVAGVAKRSSPRC